MQESPVKYCGGYFKLQYRVSLDVEQLHSVAGHKPENYQRPEIYAFRDLEYVPKNHDSTTPSLANLDHIIGRAICCGALGWKYMDPATEFTTHDDPLQNQGLFHGHFS
jgi:hypothetical protein